MCALHFIGVLWTGNGAGESSWCVCGKGCKFWGKNWKPRSGEYQYRHRPDKSGLTSEAAHELLSPQPQQAMGQWEAGQEDKSFSSEAWNTEIPSVNPKSVPAQAWVLPAELQLPGPALPSRYLCATEQLHFPPRKISYGHGSPFIPLCSICSYSVEELSLNQRPRADKISVKNSLTSLGL